jgi:hypothetical protein
MLGRGPEVNESIETDHFLDRLFEAEIMINDANFAEVKELKPHDDIVSNGRQRMKK